MRKLTRIIVKRFWGACAFLLISLAVFVAVGRELSPKLDRYKDELATFIGESLAVDIEIETLVFDWSGLSPELGLQGVSLLNPDGKVVMAMETAQLKLNLIRSIANGTLALDKIVASGVSLDFSQNQNGVWNFTGLPWTTTADDNINIDDPLDIFLLIGNIEFSEVQFDLTFRSNEQSSLNFQRLSFENSRDFHRLKSSIVVGDRREAMSLILEFRGDPRNLADFSAKGYAKLQEVDVEKVTAALPGNWQTEEPLWKNRSMTAETWFDIFSGGEFLYRGRLDVAESNSSPSTSDTVNSFKMPKAIGTNFTGRMTSKGFWSVSVRDMVLDWNDFQAPILDFEVSTQRTLANSPGQEIDIDKNLNQQQDPVSLRLSAQNIELSPWMNVINQIGVVGPKGVEALKDLNPRGLLNEVKATINLPTDKSSGNSDGPVKLVANFDEFAIDSWRGTPAVNHLKGYLEFHVPGKNILNGWIDVDTDIPGIVHFPSLYEQAMAFESVKGRVNWQVDIEQQQIDVYSGLLSVNSEDGNARGYFDLSIPLQKEPGHEELILQIGLRNSLVKHYEKYTPSYLSKDLWNWLDSSLSANDGTNSKVDSGGFIYRGGLTPEGLKKSSVQLYLDVENTDIHYHPDWPTLKKASGSLWLDQLAVHAKIKEGTVLNGSVRNLDIDIDNDIIAGEIILTLDGEFSGDASDGLNLLRSDVFKPVIKGNLDDWVMNGAILADFGLVVPIKTNSISAKQNIIVNFSDAHLLMKNINAEFDQIRGTVQFNDSLGLRGKNLIAKFLQNDVEATLLEDRQQKELLVNVKGNNSIERLRQWSGLEMLQFVDGTSEFDVNVRIPFQSNASAPTLSIQSNLVGARIDLPAPWGKPAESDASLLISSALGAQNNYFRMNYNDSLFAVFHLSGRELKRAVLSTELDPLLPEKNKVQFQGQLSELDFETWQTTYEKYFSTLSSNNKSGSGSLPLSFNLKADRFTFGGFAADQISIDADIAQNVIDVHLDSAKVAGDITAYADQSEPMDIHLEHLYLPRYQKKPPTWTDVFYPPSKPEDALEKIDPSTVPAFNFFAEEVFYGDGSLGRWSFESRPNLQGLALNNLQANFEHGQIFGKQEGEGAALLWAKTDQGTETWVQGKLVSNNLASIMEQWDQPELLQSDKADFDFTLRWPGAPTSVSTSRLEGEIAFLLEQGSFYRSGDDSSGNGLLQLISILNFDTWIRRLRLDFSDLGRRGTAFNRAQGLLEFNDGLVNLNTPLVVETQSGEFQLTGVVDMENNEIDTQLNATLPMGGNLTFLTALAAGLPAAAGVWVVSKIFDEQIDKVSTLNYRINGSLQDPEIVFDSKVDNESAASANP